MRKAQVNNAIEVAIAGLKGIVVVECFPDSKIFWFKREYRFDQRVNSLAVVKEGKSLIFSQLCVRNLQILNVETGDITLKIMSPQVTLLYNHSIHPIFTDPESLTTELFLVRTFSALYLVDLGSETDSTNSNIRKMKKKQLIHKLHRFPAIVNDG
jgi:uncharacterized membrane protein YhfC